MSTPSVSICIPTYNYARYLPDALDSACRQSFTDIEIVVVDNCSDDGTQELVSEYARRESRIVYHRNDTNIGMTGNFNLAMNLAHGKYIKFLCADDILKPDCVRSMVEVMEGSPEVSLVGCRRSIFNDDKSRTGTLGYAGKPFSRDGRRVIRECYFNGNLIGEPTAVLFRKADIVSGFDESYHQLIDLDLWFRLLESGDFVFIDDVLCGVREHGSSGSANNLRAGRVTADKARLFEQYGRRAYLDGSVAERILWDARMASSVTRELSAGAVESARIAKKALYFPQFSSSVLMPLVSIVTSLRRRAGL